MLKAYGPGVIAELDELRLSLEKVTDVELMTMLEDYRMMV
jgi:hypothetical protein